MFVRIANREDPDQTASSDLIRLLLQKQPDLDLRCLFRPFQHTNSVQNFRKLFFFCSQNVGFQVWNSQNVCQNSKQGRP